MTALPPIPPHPHPPPPTHPNCCPQPIPDVIRPNKAVTHHHLYATSSLSLLSTYPPIRMILFPLHVPPLPSIRCPFPLFLPHRVAHCTCLIIIRFCLPWVKTLVTLPHPFCPSSRATLLYTVFLTPFPPPLPSPTPAPATSPHPVLILRPLSPITKTLMFCSLPRLPNPHLPYHCHHWCPSPNSPALSSFTPVPSPLIPMLIALIPDPLSWPAPPLPPTMLCSTPHHPWPPLPPPLVPGFGSPCPTPPPPPPPPPPDTIS